MTQPVKIFVSFSGQDQLDVRKLFDALRAQGFDVWDYSRAGQELPLGRLLDEGLTERIADCDYFIAVVSANTTDEVIGRNTLFEVERAVEMRLTERERLLPLLLLNRQPGEWSGAYRQLERLMRVEVDPRQQDSVEEAVRRVCGYVDVDYVPPLLRDPRVFFSSRFMQELDEMHTVPLTNSQFSDLKGVMGQCLEQVVRKDWAAALEEIGLFMLSSDRMIRKPEERFYYPQIIKGVCELQLGEYAKAEETFRAATRHARRDELAYAGLGHTYHSQQRYTEAVVAFQEALSINPADRDIEFNILGTLLETGMWFSDDAVLKHYDTLELSPEDRFKINKVRGILLYRQGRYRAAAELFGAMKPEELDDACADYYSSALEESSRHAEAIAVLRAVAERLHNANLYHHLARAHLRMDDVESSRQVYEQHLCRAPQRRHQFLIEYARILRAFGDGDKDEERLRELCEAVLTPACFPATEIGSEEFFYMGFANYLLGKHELARYNFAQSAGFCEKYYDDPAYEM